MSYKSTVPNLRTIVRPFGLWVSVNSGNTPGVSMWVTLESLAPGYDCRSNPPIFKELTLTGSENKSVTSPTFISSPKRSSSGGVTSSVKLRTNWPASLEISTT